MIKNQIGDTGTVDLALGLSRNYNLKSLNLTGNRIKQEGGIALANSLRINSTL